MRGRYRRERLVTLLETALRVRLPGKGPPRPQTVHLEGGSMDGRHIQVLTTDRTIKIGDRTGPMYWRTHRLAKSHGCGLTIFEPAPLLPGQLPPDPQPTEILARMTKPPRPAPAGPEDR